MKEYKDGSLSFPKDKGVTITWRDLSVYAWDYNRKSCKQVLNTGELLICIYR